MKTYKNILLLLVFSLFILLGSGCSVQHHNPHYYKKGMIVSTRPGGRMPPGQMKKLAGTKSAKNFTHGHNKPHKYHKGHKRR